MPARSGREMRNSTPGNGLPTDPARLRPNRVEGQDRCRLGQAVALVDRNSERCEVLVEFGSEGGATAHQEAQLAAELGVDPREEQ